MRVLWTLAKVVLGLMLFIPLCIIALAAALGILGTLVGLAILALRLAIVGLVGYGIFRLIAALMGSGRSQPVREIAPGPAPRVDPYYEQAMRDLDREIPSR